jgi:hypothetical protein
MSMYMNGNVCVVCMMSMYINVFMVCRMSWCVYVCVYTYLYE